MKVVPRLDAIFADAKKLLSDLSPEPGPFKNALAFVVNHSSKTIDIEQFGRDKFLVLCDESLNAVYAASRTANRSLGARLDEQYLFWQFLKRSAVLGVTNSFSHRDECMASNIEFTYNEVFPKQKMFVWAHNGHVMKESATKEFTPMGSYIAQMSSNESRPYCSIGFSFLQGSFTAINGRGLGPVSVDSQFAGRFEKQMTTLNKEILFVPTGDYLATTTMRMIGAGYDTAQSANYILKFRPSSSFDAIIFIKNTTATEQI